MEKDYFGTEDNVLIEKKLKKFCKDYGHISDIFNRYVSGRRTKRDEIITALSLADFHLAGYYRDLIASMHKAKTQTPVASKTKLRLIIGGNRRTPILTRYKRPEDKNWIMWKGEKLQNRKE